MPDPAKSLIRDYVDERGYTIRQRVYQTISDKGRDWFHIGQKVYSAAGDLLSFEGGFSGTRAFLGLDEADAARVLYVKKAPF